MTRDKRGTTQRRRHNKLLKAAKGYRGLNSSLYSIAKRAVIKAGQHAYAHRKVKKRSFRALWITRLNAACRMNGMSYSRFVYGLQKKMVALDRKVMSDIAIRHPEIFKQLVDMARD